MYEKFNNFDLILSKGQSLQSKLVSILNFKSMDYTHIGIIHRFNNHVYVLHATPDGTAANGIRYDNFQTFLSLSSVSDITLLRPKCITYKDKELLEKQFEHFKTLEAPFDYDFNNFESRKIYCSELVYLIYSRTNRIYFKEFDLNKPVYPKDFLKLKSFYEINCIKTCP